MADPRIGGLTHNGPARPREQELEVVCLPGDPLETLERINSGQLSLRTALRQGKRERRRLEADERRLQRARLSGGLGDPFDDDSPPRPERVAEAWRAAPRGNPAQDAAWREALDHSRAFWNARPAATPRRAPLARVGRATTNRRQTSGPRRATAATASSGGGDPPGEGDADGSDDAGRSLGGRDRRHDLDGRRPGRRGELVHARDYLGPLLERLAWAGER